MTYHCFSRVLYFPKKYEHFYVFYIYVFYSGPPVISVGTGADGDLVVQGEMVLENRPYNFRNLEIPQGMCHQILHLIFYQNKYMYYFVHFLINLFSHVLCIFSGAVLTVMPWDGRNGGFMRICAANIINRGRIDVSGRGFRGGAGPAVKQDGFGNPGESTGGTGAQSTSVAANGGGGGGGQGNGNFGSTSGGGGGYGTAGQHGMPNTCGGGNRPEMSGRGGAIYGTAQMAEVLLGSGGGSGHRYSSGVCITYCCYVLCLHMCLYENAQYVVIRCFHSIHPHSLDLLVAKVAVLLKFDVFNLRMLVQFWPMVLLVVPSIPLIAVVVVEAVVEVYP